MRPGGVGGESRWNSTVKREVLGETRLVVTSCHLLWFNEPIAHIHESGVEDGRERFAEC
jgi:hypothetical protein